MIEITGEALRAHLSEALVAAEPGLADRLTSDPEAYLDLVVLASRVREESAALLHDAVTGARAAGLTWEAIGRALDMSRQAAQQKYGRPEPEPEPADPEAARRTTKVGPVTLFNEMRALERAGRYGWHVIGSGTAFHIVVKSDEQWEHRRVFASRAAGRALEAEGWQHLGTAWFPWGYYKRPTGEPAEPEPTYGGYLAEP